MNDIDWDAVKVGDPDPTVTDLDDEGCDATTDGPLPWCCTRPIHADGPHVAGTTETVAAVWT